MADDGTVLVLPTARRLQHERWLQGENDYVNMWTACCQYRAGIAKSCRLSGIERKLLEARVKAFVFERGL